MNKGFLGWDDYIEFSQDLYSSGVAATFESVVQLRNENLAKGKGGGGNMVTRLVILPSSGLA